MYLLRFHTAWVDSGQSRPGRRTANSSLAINANVIRKWLPLYQEQPPAFIPPRAQALQLQPQVEVMRINSLA
ncbi:hypothetical protein JOE27_001268 [Pseudomonas sp. M5]|uniref:Transposase n=1 Tax=Pseudomonas putida TaxID=303 RepID=A0A379KPC0_PSEPU|nr:hypothetical protein [Pseudomonas sp. M5]SUD69227.1 Uncharacterised protein [Pseudomonas putida]